jgi:hypothetical protein
VFQQSPNQLIECANVFGRSVTGISSSVWRAIFGFFALVCEQGRWAPIFGRSFGRISKPHRSAHRMLPSRTQRNPVTGRIAQCRTSIGRCNPALPVLMKDYYTGIGCRDGAGRRSLRLERKLLGLMVLFATTFWLLRCALPTWRRQQISPELEADNAFGPLKFRPDGTFRISIFEDLHFGESTSTTNPVPASKGSLLMLLPQMHGTPGAHSRTSTQSR